MQYEIKPYANLRDANLRDANLRGANLCGANLRDADLCGADLCGANLRFASLCGANLRDADFRFASLRGANLREADLCDADLCDADLCGANLRDAKNISKYIQNITRITPDGKFKAYKKAGGEIVTLEIPAGAKRSNATGRKCRAQYAKVLSITNNLKTVTSDRGGVYNKGEIIHCDRWEGNRWIECAGGIHFFITKYEAEQW